MRTEKLEIYSFEELSKEAQINAIEEVRESYYEDNDFASWAVDDCALFEPIQTELDLIGFESNNGNEFLIENTRENIYFDTDINSFLDCAKAIKITDDSLFLKWLGITDYFLVQKINYDIYTPMYRNSDTTIEFSFDDDFDKFTDEELKVVQNATKKFDNHIQSVLKRIENDINYRFTDEAITEDILANDYEFLKSGEQYN